MRLFSALCPSMARLKKRGKKEEKRRKKEKKKKKKTKRKGIRATTPLTRVPRGATRFHIRHTYGNSLWRKFPGISITLSWMRASYVQANNSPSMSFKGCLPRVVVVAAIAKCNARARVSCICRALECTYLYFFERRIESSVPHLVLRAEPHFRAPNTRHIVPLLAVISTTGDAVIYVIPRTHTRHYPSCKLHRCATRHTTSNYPREKYR